jgi:magnesium transporter
MINLFVLQNGRLSQEQVEDRNELLQYSNPIWIDVVDPEEEELLWIKEAFGVLLPELDDLGDLEASARYFEADDGHLHIRTDFLLDEEETSRNVRVAFVMTKQVLFSIHDEDLPVFRLVRLRARLRPGSVSNAKDVLLDLYSTDAEYSADALEEVYENLEQAGKREKKTGRADQKLFHGCRRFGLKVWRVFLRLARLISPCYHLRKNQGAPREFRE